MTKKIDFTKHLLVAKHTKLSDKDKKALLEHYRITPKELPKIRKNDPAITTLGAKEGDVIKILRPSATAGEAVFYRGVVNV